MWQQWDVLPMGGRYFTSFRRQKTEILSCLWGAVMAAADIKLEHEEVKVKFVDTAKPCISTTRQGPQWCATWATDIRPQLTPVHPRLNLQSPQCQHRGAVMHNSKQRFFIKLLSFIRFFFGIVSKKGSKCVSECCIVGSLICRSLGLGCFYVTYAAFLLLLLLLKLNSWTLTALSKRTVVGL